jgi:Tfp pilus assembly protein PilX
MKTHLNYHYPPKSVVFGLDRSRGSVLLTALIFALIIAISLVGYLRLTTQSLKLAHRTFFADAAANLAEAGLEEAVWSFNRLGNSSGSTAVTAAWTGWDRGTSVADVYMDNMGEGYSTTLPPTVTFSPPPSGTTATGTAIVTTTLEDRGGSVVEIKQVSGISVTNPGSGYTSAPTITLTGAATVPATATARIAATRTWTFNNLDQGATGTTKVWVAGYDGTAVIPIIVSRATITPREGRPSRRP